MYFSVFFRCYHLRLLSCKGENSMLLTLERLIIVVRGPCGLAAQNSDLPFSLNLYSRRPGEVFEQNVWMSARRPNDSRCPWGSLVHFCPCGSAALSLIVCYSWQILGGGRKGSTVLPLFTFVDRETDANRALYLNLKCTDKKPKSVFVEGKLRCFAQLALKQQLFDKRLSGHQPSKLRFIKN